MSALPPKADIGTQSRNVRFVPFPDHVHRSKPQRHSITLSALVSIVPGTEIPSALEETSRETRPIRPIRIFSSIIKRLRADGSSEHPSVVSGKNVKSG